MIVEGAAVCPSWNVATFTTKTAGDYLLKAEVSDGAGNTASLTFPVHAMPNANCTGKSTAQSPVAPTAGNWMWQGQQTHFTSADGTSCTGRLAIGVGGRSACFTGADGSLQCAGSIASHTYSSGTSFGPVGLANVDQVLLSLTANSATGDAICAHTTDGNVQCMGNYNDWGQCGNGSTGPTASFVTWGVPNLVAIGSGTWDQMCALQTTTGKVYCSGYNFGATPVLQGGAGPPASFWVTTFGGVNIDDTTLLRASESRTECKVTAAGLTCGSTSFGTSGHVVMGGNVARVPGTAGGPGGYCSELQGPACWLETDGSVRCVSCGTGSGGALVHSTLVAGNAIALGVNYYSSLVCAVLNDGSVTCQGAPGAAVPSAPAGSALTTCF